MSEFLMPKLGADMTAGTLTVWHKRPGDVVRRGDIIAEVDTDKGAIDVEVFVGGVVEKLLRQPGERVPVGTPLAMIREEEAAAPAVLPIKTSSVAGAIRSVETAGGVDSGSSATSPSVTSESSSLASSIAHGPTPGRFAISPSARRLARELGVDPTQVHGTGSAGAITREDIELAAAKRHTTALPAESAVASTVSVPPAAESSDNRNVRMRRAIAQAMARSKREIPHYYLSTTIDMQPALSWLASQNEQRPIHDRLLYGVLLLKAVGLALKEFPDLNALWIDDRAVTSSDIHVGVAISLRQGGLVAPALHYVDQCPIDELMRQFLDLVRRARSGALRSSELSDPTITVTNLGEQGVEAVYGVIYPPQTALVGFGKIVERPWSIASQICSRPVITATLSADHHVTDGHRGALFLAAIDRLLQEPSRL